MENLVGAPTFSTGLATLPAVSSDECGEVKAGCRKTLRKAPGLEARPALQVLIGYTGGAGSGCSDGLLLATKASPLKG